MGRTGKHTYLHHLHHFPTVNTTSIYLWHLMTCHVAEYSKIHLTSDKSSDDTVREDEIWQRSDNSTRWLHRIYIHDCEPIHGSLTSHIILCVMCVCGFCRCHCSLHNTSVWLIVQLGKGSVLILRLVQGELTPHPMATVDKGHCVVVVIRPSFQQWWWGGMGWGGVLLIDHSIHHLYCITSQLLLVL